MTGYFDYLCREAGIGGPQGLPYRRMASWLLAKPFTSSVAGDKNRIADGMELRRGYSDAPKGCGRVLEVMVAMCQKLDYMAYGMVPANFGGPEAWFMRMIENLGVASLTDGVWDKSASDAEEIMQEQVGRWLDRDYEYDGTGGIFPLSHPNDDQAKVELWYQMNAYLMEQIGEI